MNIRNFRTIADEMMDDIRVDSMLKNKTLQRCMTKRPVQISKLLAAAACVVLIFGFANRSGFLLLNINPGDTGNQEMNIMAASNEGVDTLLGQPSDSMLEESGVVEDWQIKTLAEAENIFVDDFLIPSTIPENFKLETIFASGKSREAVEKITLSYFDGDRSFLIIEQKGQEQNMFVQYKQVEINGAGGYVKSDLSGGDQNVNSPVTELHWFKDGFHYSVAGLISEAEALEAAASMK